MEVEEDRTEWERQQQRWAKRYRRSHARALNSMIDTSICDDGDVCSSWFDTAAVESPACPRGPLITEGDCGSSGGGEWEISLRQEIAFLFTQLSLVKCRLGAAAIRCADAVNNHFHHLSSSKKTFATTSHDEFRQARYICNPYEILGEGNHGGLNTCFMNRSAIKLANIDALVSFQLTRISEASSAATTTSSSFSSSNLFRFVDLCGAPGGFSEYLLRRCCSSRIPCSGFGMSLVGQNNEGHGISWRLESTNRFYMDNGGKGLRSSFQICHGEDNTGDICNWKNVQCLKRVVALDQWECQCGFPGNENDDIMGRVHLVVADGGMDAQRNVDHQEQVCQKLVVCQASAAMELLLTGGTLVLKMFGFQTGVVKKMMQDLVYCFEDMVILKPISSRPASAERYVVFSGFKNCALSENSLSWQNRTFLGESSSPSVILNSLSSHRLHNYLQSFDRDMLALNLQACFSILTRLESKRHGHAQNGDGQGMLVETGALTPGQEKRSVNIAAYRKAWRLT